MESKFWKNNKQRMPTVSIISKTITNSKRQRGDTMKNSNKPKSNF